MEKQFCEIDPVCLDGAEVRCLFPRSDYPSDWAVRGAYKELAGLPVQVHSNDVVILEESDPLPEADAVVSFTPGVTVGVVTADCVPILLYAPDVKGVAAVHAGWRGTLGGVLSNTVRVLRQRGADPANIKAVFGPSISLPFYEVDKELAYRFTEAGFSDFIDNESFGSSPHIDLQGINARRLIDAGVPKENIVLSEYCTFSSLDSSGNPLLPSHRRSGGSPARLLSSITLK